MNPIEHKLCDIQGCLFVNSSSAHLSSRIFIDTFMNSQVTAYLDQPYNRMQWAGEEYLLDELRDETHIAHGEDFYHPDVLYWIGYLYRYWHIYSNESSKQISRTASAETMRRNYTMFHTMDPALAVEELKEVHRQRDAIS